MCRAFEEVKEEGRQQGRLEGERNTKIETARNAILMGLSDTQTSSLTGLSLEEISSLKVTEES